MLFSNSIHHLQTGRMRLRTAKPSDYTKEFFTFFMNMLKSW